MATCSGLLTRTYDVREAGEYYASVVSWGALEEQESLRRCKMPLQTVRAVEVGGMAMAARVVDTVKWWVVFGMRAAGKVRAAMPVHRGENQKEARSLALSTC